MVDKGMSARVSLRSEEQPCAETAMAEKGVSVRVL